MTESELALLEGKALSEVESKGLKALWIKENNITLEPDFANFDFAQTMHHIKYRDYDVNRSTGGIGGAHDALEFARHNSEYFILSINPLRNVPGVNVIEYRIQALDKTGKPTGVLKSKIYTKTVYDRSIWSNSKLESAAKEAFQYSFNQYNGQVPREWSGVTKEGYNIHGYFEGGQIKSFYFE